MVRMSDTEKGISLPSYDPFAAEDDDTCGLLFALTVDDTFYPSVKGELIGEFDCGAAYFGVYRLADGTYQMLVSPPDGQYCGLMQASPDFKEANLRIFTVKTPISSRTKSTDRPFGAVGRMPMIPKPGSAIFT